MSLTSVLPHARRQLLKRKARRKDQFRPELPLSRSHVVLAFVLSCEPESRRENQQKGGRLDEMIERVVGQTQRKNACPRLLDCCGHERKGQTDDSSHKIVPVAPQIDQCEGGEQKGRCRHVVDNRYRKRLADQ